VSSQQSTNLNDGIVVVNNEEAIRDRYSVSASGTGPEVAGWRFRQMRIDLFDPSQSAFTDDSLPSTPPSLSSFAQRAANFVFTNLPIPPTLVLFGTGVSVLVALRAAGRRLHKSTSK